MDVVPSTSPRTAGSTCFSAAAQVVLLGHAPKDLANCGGVVPVLGVPPLVMAVGDQAEIRSFQAGSRLVNRSPAVLRLSGNRIQALRAGTGLLSMIGGECHQPPPTSCALLRVDVRQSTAGSP